MSLGFGFSLPSFESLGQGFGFGASLIEDFTSGNNILDPRITFSRTSNATVTGSNGLIQYAPHNLLTYSEQFDNAAWTKTDITVAANAIAAPDGSFTADLLTEGSAGTAALTRATVSLNDGATSAYSFYVKRGNTDILRCVVYSSTNQIRTWVNVATGQVLSSSAGGTGTVVSATMTAAGNGWYRVALVGSITGSATGSIQVNSATADGGGGRVPGATYYLWGAQLEIGSTATTYNSTTVKNLLGYSQAFDNAAWTKSNATVAATLYDGPFGYLGAEKLVENTAASAHYIEQSVTAGTKTTGSYYVKAGERTKCETYMIDSVGIVAGSATVYNLANGTVEAGGGAIVSVGGGWYRVSTTASLTAGSQRFRLLMYTTSDSYTGDGTSGIYIFGAQLSDSASLDPYVYNVGAAPSAAAYYGPRFDYDPVTLDPKGLLIEEQRTNLVLNSDTLSTQNVTVSATAYTLSFYGTGTVTLSGVSTAGPLVGSGAYPSRVTLTFTPTAGTLTLTVSGSVRFAQLEAGSFATSYIPTVASQVTRAADTATMSGTNFSQWYNQNAGTFYAAVRPIAPPPTGKTARFLEVNDGTINNRNPLVYGIPTGSATAQYRVGGVDQANLNSGAIVFSANSLLKTATAYQVNDFAAAFNGGNLQTDTAGALISGANELDIGYARSTATEPLNGWIERIAYYSRRLANSELQALTA